MSRRRRLIACALLVTLAHPVFAQQPPEGERKRKTRICAVEDEVEVEGVDGPRTSRRLKPGYCVDCWIGYGCGVPFLAGGLLGLLGTTGAVITGVGAVAAGGILGGLAGSGVFGGGGGGSKGPPGGGIPPPGIPPPFPIPGGPPIPLPTQVPVSPFQ